MTEVTFILRDGTTETIDIGDGVSVMQGAVFNDVGGIDGECGGSCACATCHVYVESTGTGTLPPMSDTEDALLDSVAAERRDTSRLACQIPVGPHLRGLVIRVPDRQA